MDRVTPVGDDRLHPWQAFLFEQSPEMPGIKKPGAPSSSSNTKPCTNVFTLGLSPKPRQISTNLCLSCLTKASCQAEQAHAIQVKQANAKTTDYKPIRKSHPAFFPRSTEMPRRELAAPKSMPTSPTCCCCKRSHTVLQDLAQGGI